MRAIGRAIKPGARDPRMDDPGILPGRQVRLRSDPAGKEVPGVPASNVGKPRLDRGSGLLGDLELHSPARFLLNDGRAVADPAADADTLDLQPHEIAAPEFAVDSIRVRLQVERRARNLALFNLAMLRRWTNDR